MRWKRGETNRHQIATCSSSISTIVVLFKNSDETGKFAFIRIDNPYWASLSVSVIRIEVRKDLREVTVGSSVWMNVKTPASYSCIQIYFQMDIQTIQKHLKEDFVVNLN